jgi:hypothetical protein
VFHHTLENQLGSAGLLGFFYFIETLQLFYYSIHPKIQNLFNTPWLDYIRTAVKYTHVASSYSRPTSP